jgi:hypothetical protein
VVVERAEAPFNFLFLAAPTKTFFSLLSTQKQAIKHFVTVLRLVRHDAGLSLAKHN